MKSIVLMPEAKEFPIYKKLDKTLKQMFEKCLEWCDRFVLFEDKMQMNEYFKDIEQKDADYLKSALKEFGFCFKKIKLSEFEPEQKILYIYHKE